jgi:5-methylcytosine-specific restriction enzyme A
MTMTACLDCGQPCAGPRCPEHTTVVDTKPTAHARGYDASWTRLSKRARRLQPFCTDCGATEDLQCDHTPEAWERKAAGKRIRLQDIDVVCGPCNRARGAARPQQTPARPQQTPLLAPTRGMTPPTSPADPPRYAKFGLHTEIRPIAARPANNAPGPANNTPGPAKRSAS